MLVEFISENSSVFESCNVTGLLPYVINNNIIIYYITYNVRM